MHGLRRRRRNRTAANRRGTRLGRTTVADPQGIGSGPAAHPGPVEIELFAGGRLEAELEHTFCAVVRHMARIPADQILAADDEHIVQGLLRDARADCPELLTDRIESLPMMEYSQDIGLYGDGTSIVGQVSRYRIVVPFTADTLILRSRPSRTSLAHPAALGVRG